MIVRDRPSGLQLFWILRGSILPRILPSLAITLLIAIGVTLTHGDLFRLKITLSVIPFTLLGLPLAIFLGFRNSAAYDRFWEARKLWGELVHLSRSLVRQCVTLIDGEQAPAPNGDLLDMRVRMTYRTIAFSHALRHSLRDEALSTDLQPLLPTAEWVALQATSNAPDWLLRAQGRDLAAAVRHGQIPDCLAANIDRTLSAMAASAAGCERIRRTPLPFSYTLLLHRTAYLYCFLLPFGLVDSVGFMTPVVVALIAYTFFGLDALGDEIEEPFGTQPNDLPLDALCRTIEIDMREALGETTLPAPLAPVDACLS